MKIDETPVNLPKSFTTRIDLLTAWGDSPNRQQLARLCAATVALCLDIGKPAPKYNTATGDVMAYGAAALDWLVGQGITPTAIYKRGPLLVEDLSESIPTESEVDDKAAGFPDGEGSTK